MTDLLKLTGWQKSCEPKATGKRGQRVLKTGNKTSLKGLPSFEADSAKFDKNTFSGLKSFRRPIKPTHSEYLRKAQLQFFRMFKTWTSKRLSGIMTPYLRSCIAQTHRKTGFGPKNKAQVPQRATLRTPEK